MRWLTRAAVAAAAMAVGGVAPLQASGRCISVDVPAAFIMPDGDVHEPGKLRLCDERALSPVAKLHKVYVHGHLVGLVQSRTDRLTGSTEPEPFVKFRRTAGSQLELVGYSWPEGERVTTYVLQDSGGRLVNAGPATMTATNANEAREFILVAARAD